MLIVGLSSSSNLTLPPPIPGFEARLLFDPNPSLNLFEVYNNAIQMMAWLAPSAYSDTIDGPARVSDYVEELSNRPWPPSSKGRLQIKHLVQAIYEAGFALAAKPITVRGTVPRLHAGLFLDGQQIGFMKWQHKRNPVAGGANSTVSLIDAANSTAVLPARAWGGADRTQR